MLGSLASRGASMKATETSNWYALKSGTEVNDRISRMVLACATGAKVSK